MPHRPTTPHHQHPVGSGFGPHSTAEDVLRGVDLTGRRVVVTAGHTGLGAVVTCALATAGAHVTVACRHPERVADELGDIPGVDLDQLDLLEPASVARLRPPPRHLRAPPRRPGQQRGPARTAPARGGLPRLRGAAGHQLPGPLPAHPGPAPRAAGRRTGPGGQRHLRCPPLQRHPLERPSTSRPAMTLTSPTPSPRPPGSCSPSSSTTGGHRRASAATPCTPASSSAPT